MELITFGDYNYFINIEWRQIKHNGGLINYEISNTGDFRNSETKNLLKPFIDKDGYLRYSFIVNGQIKHTFAHRLVAEAFIPNPENKPQVNHINGKKDCNIVDNLEWVTAKENVRHSWNHGLKKSIKGERNKLSKYTEKQIHQVCKLLENGKSNKEISNKTGVNKKYITDIKKGRRWKHISKKYNINHGKNSNSKKYSIQLKQDIINLLIKGYKTWDILEELNLSDTNAHRYLIQNLKGFIRE